MAVYKAAPHPFSVNTRTQLDFNSLECLNGDVIQSYRSDRFHRIPRGGGKSSRPRVLHIRFRSPLCETVRQTAIVCNSTNRSSPDYQPVIGLPLPQRRSFTFTFDEEESRRNLAECNSLAWKFNRRESSRRPANISDVMLRNFTALVAGFSYVRET